MPIPSSSSERCSESFGEHKVPRMVISMALNATFFHYPNHCFRCYRRSYLRFHVPFVPEGVKKQCDFCCSPVSHQSETSWCNRPARLLLLKFYIRMVMISSCESDWNSRLARTPLSHVSRRRSRARPFHRNIMMSSSSCCFYMHSHDMSSCESDWNSRLARTSGEYGGRTSYQDDGMTMCLFNSRC
jgi:hypothetical protein